MRSKGNVGVGVGVPVGVAVGSGSRYKVTARCVPEVSITSPTTASGAIQPKHFALLRSRSQPSPPTSNSLFSTPGGATLVEEEDFSLASGSGTAAKNVLQRQLATTVQQEDPDLEHSAQEQHSKLPEPAEPPNELTPLVEEPGSVAPTTSTHRYSHNSKTTRSWPVIYRNPHHCDYEALYVQQQQQQQSFKQNCYSNQFKQSIVYSSSNEELPGGEPVASSSAENRQTTCYYFAPSRHNSIYEHPSSVVGGSLQFDNPTTTAAAAAAVESLRRSNSILLRQNSCAKVIQRRGSGSGSPTSLGSQMEGLGMGMGGGGAGSACCSSCCMGPPPVLFLFVTLLMTTSATAMLCAAIMTDHWEHVTWDRNSLDRYTNRSGLHLEWLLDDQVAMLKPDKRGNAKKNIDLYIDYARRLTVPLFLPQPIIASGATLCSWCPCTAASGRCASICQFSSCRNCGAIPSSLAVLRHASTIWPAPWRMHAVRSSATTGSTVSQVRSLCSRI